MQYNLKHYKDKICILCNKKINLNTIIYYYSDKCFCTDKCRDIFMNKKSIDTSVKKDNKRSCIINNHINNHSRKLNITENIYIPNNSL